MPAPTKNTKKTASKAKVGTGKQASSWRAKLPKSKWKLGYRSLAVLLLISTVGYAGFSTYRGHQMKAKAENWTYLGSQYGYRNTGAWACKYVVNTIYGPLYKVRVLFNRGANYNLTYGVIKLEQQGVRTYSNMWQNSIYGSFLTLEALSGPVTRSNSLSIYMAGGSGSGTSSDPPIYPIKSQLYPSQLSNC